MQKNTRGAFWAHNVFFSLLFSSQTSKTKDSVSNKSHARTNKTKREHSRKDEIIRVKVVEFQPKKTLEFLLTPKHIFKT